MSLLIVRVPRWTGLGIGLVCKVWPFTHPSGATSQTASRWRQASDGCCRLMCSIGVWA